MSSLDAAISAQLANLKQNANVPHMMMAAPPRPAQSTPGFPGMPQGMSGPAAMMAPTGPQAPPQAMPQMGGGGGPAPNATLLSVAINNLPFRYTLQEADLREMCHRWGQINAVHIYREGAREVGVIVFADPVDAADCQRQLNNFTCNLDSPQGPAQGSLAAVIGSPEQLSPPIRQAGPGAMPMGATGPMGAMGGPQMSPGGQPGNFHPQGQMGMGAIPKSMPLPGDAMKGKGKGANGYSGPPPGWSCKLVVHAERLHPEFPTITKIVGVNNMNFEHIRSQGNCTVELRGQRSGTIDARIGKELQEPMFLYLASDTAETGCAALDMVKDLLMSVYDEHGQWCLANNVPWQQETLQPMVIENPHLTEGF